MIKKAGYKGTKKKKTTTTTTTRKKPAVDVDVRKQVLARAIVDPAFRKSFLAAPEKVFGVRSLNKADKEAVNRLKKTLPALDDLVGSLAGEILCGGGGGCPGLA